MNYVVAVDVGGTGIKAALVGENLNVLAEIKRPTPNSDPTGRAVVDEIVSIVTEFSAQEKISALGFAVPGALDEVEGIAHWTGNLGWKELPIRALLQEKLDIPVTFGHDVRRAALAEMRSGAAKGANNAVFIPVGTGIAAALIIDGEIRSSHGFAGEIGHVNVGFEHLCVCGKRGCLEAVASALAIATSYKAKTGREASAKKVLELTKTGDVAAIEAWDDATLALSRMVLILTTLLAPEVIVLGGGVALAGSALVDPINAYLDSEITFQRRPRIELAQYGAEAGAIGNAIAALDLLKGANA